MMEKVFRLGLEGLVLKDLEVSLAANYSWAQPV